MRIHSRNQLSDLLELAAFERPEESPDVDSERWRRWTYDTVAAISAFPLDVQIGTEPEANGCSCKTASGELISEHGGLRVQGKTEYDLPSQEGRHSQNVDQRKQSSQ